MSNARLSDERLADLLSAETQLAISIPEMRSILTELQSLRSSSTPAQAVRVTDEMVERACDSLFSNWRDRAAWTQKRMQGEARAALTAALSALEDAPQQEALLDAAKDIISSRSSTYKARNGRLMSIEDDSGEMMWIVPFDEMVALEAVVAALSHPQHPSHRKRLR